MVNSPTTSNLQRLVSEPEKFVDELFNKLTNHGQKLGAGWSEELTSHIQQMLDSVSSKDELYSKIPSLGSMDLGALRQMNGKVVRFRCMIQEQYDPLLCQSVAFVKDMSSGQIQEQCLLFRENLKIEENQQQVNTSSTSNLQQLEIFHCISVPGENDWVFEMDKFYNMVDTNGTELASGEIVKRCSGGMDENAIKSCFAFPLPSMEQDPLKYKAVIAKVYQQSHKIVLNDVVDMYGILHFEECETDCNHSIGGCCDMDDSPSETALEYRVRNPPLSLIPRLSVLYMSKNCSFETPKAIFSLQQFEQLTMHDNNLQSRLMDLLVDCFMGDKMCAEYVLLHLLSNVNARTGTEIVGSLPICISGLSLEMCQLVNSVIQALVVKSVHVENVLESLEKDCYIPWKNYECNKIIGGLLQLSSGTHLLLQENESSEGQQRNLMNSPKAMRNLKALQKLIEWQTVDYDFKFQQMEFQVNVPVLILSTSSRNNSMFKVAVQVPFNPTVTCEKFDTTIKPRILETLKDKSFMSSLRDFVLYAKQNIAFNISSQVEQIVSTDFTSNRRSSSRPEWSMEQDDFSRTLTIARYLLQFKGQTELTEEMWWEARGLESRRKLSLTVK